MSVPTGTVEVEIKFDVLDRVATRATLGAAGLGDLRAVGRATRTRLIDRYVDTPDGRLHAAGWAARIRTVGELSRINLKALRPADDAGIARRQELEGEAGPGLSPDPWPTSAARRRLIQLTHGEPLIEVLVLHQDRLARCFGDSSGALELSLDLVEVLVGDQPVGRRLVLEIEQQTATEEAFHGAITQLEGLAHLAPSRSTKLGWGLEVARRRTADDGLPVLGPIDPSFGVDDPTAEVGRVILATQLRTMIDRERVAHQAVGPEEIRKLRVATRRARATLRAFEGSYAGPRPDRLRRGLRRFARLLNDVRNLDVLIAHVGTYLDDVGPEDRPAIEALRGAVEERRALALAALMAEFASDRHRRLIGVFADFVQRPGGDVAPVSPPGPRRLSDELGGWIWSRFEELVGWRPILETADLDTLHELRLQVKRLRDLLQVVTTVTGPGTAAIAESLVDLQDALGAMNDAAVASAWLRAYLTSLPATVQSAGAATIGPAETAAIERFALMLENRIAVARARVPATWRRVTGSDGRRRIGRLIGGI